MLNAIGLQNIGLARFVAEKLPWLVISDGLPQFTASSGTAAGP